MPTISLFARHSFWDELKSTLRVNSTPLAHLLTQVEPIRKHLKAHPKDIEKLLLELEQSLSAGLSAEQLEPWRGIKDYLRCYLGQAPAVSFSQARPAYQDMVKQLLEIDLLPAFQQGISIQMDFSQFKKKADLLEHMSNWISPGLTASGSPETHSTLLSCLHKLMNWFRAHLHLAVKPSDKGYVTLADSLWRLMQHLDASGTMNAEQTRSLIAWHRRGVEYVTQKTYFYESRLQESFSANEIIGKVSSKQMIKRVISNLNEDLSHLKSLCGHEARALIFTLILESNTAEVSAEMAQAYFNLIEKVEGHLQVWSEQAWVIRKHYEKLLRTDKDYLSLLEAFDNGLRGLAREQQGFRYSLRDEINTLFKERPFFRQANECLAELDSESIRILRQANWVHHTAYGPLDTEGYLAKQMNAWEARSKIKGRTYFERYHLRYTYTLADYVVESLPQAWKIVRPLVLRIHPDKVAPEAIAEKVIREACFKRLQQWQEQAAGMCEIWTKGQWLAAAPEDALAIEGNSRDAAIPEEPQSNMRIARPTQALDLSVLEIQKNYLIRLVERFDYGQDARKRTNWEVPTWRHLHKGSAEDREFFENAQAFEDMMCEAVKAQRERLARAEAELVAAKQERDAALRLKEESTRALEKQIRIGKEMERRLSDPDSTLLKEWINLRIRHYEVKPIEEFICSLRDYFTIPPEVLLRVVNNQLGFELTMDDLIPPLPAEDSMADNRHRLFTGDGVVELQAEVLDENSSQKKI
jgi:hypothetical protein